MGILRYFLALVVVIGHAPATILAKPLNGDGGLAVQTFYVISGFYMALIINKYKDVKSFYLSRALRIYPLYWICFLTMWAFTATHILAGSPLPADVLQSLDSLQDKIFYVCQSVFIFGQDVMRFTIYHPVTHEFFATFTGTANTVVENHLAQIGSDFPLLGQAWTLSLELCFYLLVPFLLSRTRMTVVAICVASLSLKLALYYCGYAVKNYNIQVAFFPTALGMFLLGAISQQNIYPWLRRQPEKCKQYCAYALISLLVYYVICLFPRIGSYDLKYELFIFLVAAALPFLFNYSAQSALDKFIGELSFPVYMTHLICLGLLKHCAFISANMLGYWSLLVATLVSIILVYAVIKPLDNFRHTHLSKRVIPVAAGMTSETILLTK